MSGPTSSSSALVNPLASVAQLEQSSSSLDGVPQDLENSIKYFACKLIQAAGVLLRLPQDIIAQIIVIFTRFWVGADGGSLREYGAKDIAAATLFLVTKPSAHPKSPRAILTVFAYLSVCPPWVGTHKDTRPDAENYHLSEGTYQRQRLILGKHESIILQTLGFSTHVALPYTLCINYLQTIGVFATSQLDSQKVSRRAFANLNTALLSPQLLYLTHQPNALATAAIYLSAREIGVKLPEEEWWEVFDCDREELGFLVVGFLSMAGWAKAEEEKWKGRKVPLTVAEVNEECSRREQEAENNQEGTS